MQEITDGIREYDKNHMVFAERVCAVKDSETGNGDWGISIPDTQFLLNDDNAVYEFHVYDPYSFTHQDMSWAGTTGQIKYYPSDEIIASNIINGWVGCNPSTPTDELEDGWVEYQSEPITKTDSYNIGSITLKATTGADGTAFFDDIVLEEYKDGKLVSEIRNLNFNSESGNFNFWSSDGNGGSSYSYSDGYNGSGCISVYGTTSDANITGYTFEIEDGCEYIIKGKVKKTNTDIEAMPRIDFSLAESVMTLNADYLEANMMTVLEFGEKNNVPMYLGEFGAAVTACKDDRGGEQWTADMLDICKKHNVHFTYHTYHEATFGLYQNSAYSLPEQKNEKLAEVFRNKLSNS